MAVSPDAGKPGNALRLGRLEFGLRRAVHYQLCRRALQAPCHRGVKSRRHGNVLMALDPVGHYSPSNWLSGGGAPQNTPIDGIEGKHVTVQITGEHQAPSRGGNPGHQRSGRRNCHRILPVSAFNAVSHPRRVESGRPKGSLSFDEPVQGMPSLPSSFVGGATLTVVHQSIALTYSVLVFGE